MEQSYVHVGHEASAVPPTEISAELKQWAREQDNATLLRYSEGPLADAHAQAARWELQRGDVDDTPQASASQPSRREGAVEARRPIPIKIKSRTEPANCTVAHV